MEKFQLPYRLTLPKYKNMSIRTAYTDKIYSLKFLQTL